MFPAAAITGTLSASTSLIAVCSGVVFGGVTLDAQPPVAAALNEARLMLMTLAGLGLQVADTAEAFILFNVRGHADLPSGALWKTLTDRARMRFERQGKKWLILSGI